MSYLNSLTRLLAEENLIIVEGNFKTASIDINTRVVRLPSHYNQELAVQILFRAHEVGHALYTPFEALHDQIEKNKKFARVLFPYINIVEDVRIEKMIQMKFPGLRKDFQEGYKILVERGFFGKSFPKGHKNDQHFADRLNYHFKVGAALSGVVFTPVEKKIYDLVDSCITFSDTLEAAKVLYEYCKEQQKKMQAPQQSMGMGEDGDTEEGDEGEANSGPTVVIVMDGDGDTEEGDEGEEIPEDAVTIDISGDGEGDSEENEEETEGDGNGNSEGQGEERDSSKSTSEGDTGSGSSDTDPNKELERLKDKTKNKNYKDEDESDEPPAPETFNEKENASENMAVGVRACCFNPTPPNDLIKKPETYKTLLM